MADIVSLWNSNLLIGVEIIDRQHHELVEWLEDLINTIKVGKEKPKIIETVFFIQNYTINHFATEEEFMHKIEYEETEIHKALHVEFKQTMQEVKSKVLKNATSPNSVLLVEGEMVKWYVNHILQADKKIGVAINRFYTQN